MNIILIYGRGEITKKDLENFGRTLSRFDVKYLVVEPENNTLEVLEEVNRLVGKTYIIIVGSDRLLLKTLINLGDRSISVIPLAGRRSSGFFTIRSINEFNEIVMDLIKGKFNIRRMSRLVAWDGDTSLPPAFNDIVVLNTTPGKLIRYSLYINSEYMWNDTSDGIIVSTPVGSTGYSLSAGGPIIRDVDAVTIVPINSLFPSHKPIVTSINNSILLVGLSSREYVAVVDGQYRHIVESDRLLITKSKHSVEIIDFYNASTDLDTRLSMRVPRESSKAGLEGLPPSAKFVYRILEYEGGLTLREIISKTLLPPRTVRHALKILVEGGFLKKEYLDRDARISIYKIK